MIGNLIIKSIKHEKIVTLCTGCRSFVSLVKHKFILDTDFLNFR